MKQIRLLISDWCLRLALAYGSDYWSIATIHAYVALVASIRKDIEDDHQASA